MKIFKTDRIILFKANKTLKNLDIIKPKLSVNPFMTQNPEQKPVLVQNNFLNKKKNFFNVEKIGEIPVEEKEIKEGRWTLKEHISFLKAIDQYGTNWGKISSLIPTRTNIQIKTHANKFLNKLKHFKDETLGIDLTNITIRNIKDVINHIKSVNNEYNIFNIFLLISGKNFDKKDKKNSESKYKKKSKNFKGNHVDIFNINNIYNDFEKVDNGEELSKENDVINNNILNNINNSFNNDFFNNLNFITNFNNLDIMSYNLINNLIFTNITNNLTNNIHNQYLYISNKQLVNPIQNQSSLNNRNEKIDDCVNSKIERK